MYFGSMSKIIKITDPEYPDLLRHIYDAPEVLYVRGDIEILNRNLVAFVGTRNCTPYGREVVRNLVSDLSLCDLGIVSGLARGIDSVAHEAALNSGLPTVAVLGTGIDNIYPPENQGLADRIISSGGCIVSEYPGNKPSLSYHFPARNRIIAGLSLATVVIEAPESSGALITAKRANEENRDVFAVPADVDRLESVGCNKLIQAAGVRLVMSGMDIIRELAIQPAFFAEESLRRGKEGSLCDKLGLDENPAKVLKAVPRTKPVSIDQIVETTGFSLREINKLLSLLEIQGFVIGTDSGFYLRTC